MRYALRPYVASRALCATYTCTGCVASLCNSTGTKSKLDALCAASLCSVHGCYVVKYDCAGCLYHGCLSFQVNGASSVALEVFLLRLCPAQWALQAESKQDPLTSARTAAHDAFRVTRA